VNLDKLQQEFSTARDRYHEARRAAEDEGSPISEATANALRDALQQYGDVTARYTEALMNALGFVQTPKRK